MATHNEEGGFGHREVESDLYVCLFKTVHKIMLREKKDLKGKHSFTHFIK
jgi:hypothetical protein